MYLRSTDSANGDAWSPYYVGKGKVHRAYNHKSHSMRTPRDKSHIVIIADNLSEDAAFMCERAWIALLGRIDTGTGCLRNLTNGGDGASGSRHSDATRTKLSLANLGRVDSPERIAKMARSRKGQRVSPATEFKRGHVQSPETIERSAAAHRGKPRLTPWLIGRTHSAESKAKMSANLRLAWECRKANGPVIHSPETRAKIAKTITATLARRKGIAA